MDCSPTGSSVRGILQARILEWADPGIEPESLRSLALAGKLFTTWEVLDFHRHAKILERIFVYLSSSYASDII